MKRAIFSTAIFFIICFLFQGMALATGGSWGHSHSNTPRVHNLADILKSGEIVGEVNFCGAQGTNGAHVDLVGESFTAVLGASGAFKLRYVPRGAYTLRVSIPGQPEHTQPVTVKRRQVTDVGGISLCPDNDGDGFALNLDCNDNNAEIFPGAEELCDGVDNDCDGAVDGPGCNCTDADNDGFFAQEGCGTAVDCNDTSNTINPNADEICDGVDNNCDGADDEGFDLNTDLNNCGACSNVCSGSCQAGQCFAICGNGVVEEGEECDDGNTTDGDGCQADCSLPAACNDGTPSGESRPCDGPDSDFCVNGFQVCENGVFSACEETITDIAEICNGIDDNCDGVSDEGTVAGECNDGNICTTDSCNSSAGCSNFPLPIGTPCGSGLACDGLGVCQTTDSDGDGFPSDVDCNDNDPSINPGAVDVCNGIDDNCNNTTDENTTEECSPYECGGPSGCFTTCGSAGNGSDTFCAPGFHCENSDQDVLSCVPDIVPVCGNGVVEAGEQCDGGSCCTSQCAIASAATVCRSSTGQCDVTETCNGVAANCPFDASAPAGTLCGNGNTCNGSGTCLTSCGSDSQCASGFFCNGSCRPQEPSGESCNRDGECLSGNCITLLGLNTCG